MVKYLLLGVGGFGSIFASSHDTALPLLGQLGIAAPFAGALFLAWKQSVARGDRLEKIVIDMLPVMGQNADAQKEVIELLREIRRDLDKRKGSG